ncbi:MAG: V-type ATP synthase subunit C [Firmicutes bacterium]|nr:V-type ATP synthase subunit C [Bacillota bacterium]
MPNSDRYLYAVGRISVMETRLVDSSKIERMVEAKDAEEALKVLAETEYAGHMADLGSVYEYEKILEAELRRVYLEVRKMMPSPEIISLFARKFDYHNLKVLIKAKYLQENRNELLVKDVGNIDLDVLMRAVSDEDFSDLPPLMREAAEEITEAFRLEVDPQLVDLRLDQAMYAEIFADLKALKIPFLTGYFTRFTDLTNIKTLLRIKRLGLDRRFLAQALLPAGEIEAERLLEQLDEPLELILDGLAHGPYAKVVEDGILTYQKTDTLTRYEKLADDYLIDYIKQAKHNKFGPEPIVGYLLAKENEIKIIRIIMVGKINQLPVEEIKERLRDVYV